MKKIFLIVSALTIIANLPSFAELTVQDTTSEEYLKNQGYSKSVINAVQRSKCVASGEKYVAPVDKGYQRNPIVKFVKRIITYIDPALDDDSFYNKHNIHTSPSIEDL